MKPNSTTLTVMGHLPQATYRQCWIGTESDQSSFGWIVRSLYLSSIWQQPVTVYKTSTYSTHHTRLHGHTLVLSYNHWYRYRYSYRYRRWKKYRVSEVSVNPGIGLSLFLMNNSMKIFTTAEL